MQNSVLARIGSLTFRLTISVFHCTVFVSFVLFVLFVVIRFF